MKNFKIIAVIALLSIVSISTAGTDPDLKIQISDTANPWTHLQFNNNPDNFQFAIISDVWGGYRPPVFERAVEKLNLLNPEFVMSIGDLINGYIEDTTELDRQWDEFDGFVKKLKMPFFYTPGNHDYTNAVMAEKWQQRLGASYYHFIYRDVLFLSLCTDDPPTRTQSISDKQTEYVRKVLKDNKNVRWTFVFMHQPIFKGQNPDDEAVAYKDWQKLKPLLENRPNTTIFAGHEHRYQKYELGDQKYYILSTTGGSGVFDHPEDSACRFDHIVWVTMTNDGPAIANLMLEGIQDDDPCPRPHQQAYEAIPQLLKQNLYKEAIVQLKRTIKLAEDDSAKYYVENYKQKLTDVKLTVAEHYFALAKTSLATKDFSAAKEQIEEVMKYNLEHPGLIETFYEINTAFEKAQALDFKQKGMSYYKGPTVVKQIDDDTIKLYQLKAAEHYGLDVKKTVDLPDGVKINFALIPPGIFLMGSKKNEACRDWDNDEDPSHLVKISRPFYIGTCEVTQAQFKAVTSGNPSYFKGNDLPVEQISWSDAAEFCKKLSRIQDGNFRLPTEAEWEYACRAGTVTPFNTGMSIGIDQANYDGRHPYPPAPYDAEALMRKKTTAVASFAPNAWGLYDMHGNVWEWCSDYYDKEYYGRSPAVDPQGPLKGSYHVLRGAAFNRGACICRSANRHSGEFVRIGKKRGFRVVMTANINNQP